MKPVAVCILLVFTIFTIDSCNSQGGGGISANIAAYLTLYREREKKRKEAMKNKRPVSNNRPTYGYYSDGDDYNSVYYRPVRCNIWFGVCF